MVHYLKLKTINFIKTWHADQKHNVEKYEAEAVFWNDPVYKLSRLSDQGKKRFVAFGETDEGRQLVVIYEIESVNEITVVTAREMEPEEKRYYNKNRRD